MVSVHHCILEEAKGGTGWVTLKRGTGAGSRCEKLTPGYPSSTILHYSAKCCIMVPECWTNLTEIRHSSLLTLGMTSVGINSVEVYSKWPSPFSEWDEVHILNWNGPDTPLMTT